MEQQHPEFEAFKRRALADPEVRREFVATKVREWREEQQRGSASEA